MVTTQKSNAPTKKASMMKKIASQTRQQRDSLFFFPSIMPSSSSIMVLLGAHGQYDRFLRLFTPPATLLQLGCGSTRREPGFGGCAANGNESVDVCLKCLVSRKGLAAGLSRGVTREKLCESESTSCVESRDGDCTK